MSVAPSPHPREARFYELDILRGLAAIVVVIFHYKHFLLISEAAGFDYVHMPFYRLLMPVYVYGQFFVELFFSISGYVFFWLYADVIAQRKTGGKSFFIARFSRLYPLYFATFIVVAVMQWGFYSLHGHAFIYHNNDGGNFVRNLLMVQQWWPDPDLSFNGPAWSISVEVFLYALFFLVCFLRLNRPWVVALLVIGGLVYKYTRYDPANDFARGVPSFFLGGLVFYAVTMLRQHEAQYELWRRRIVWGLAATLPLLWALSYLRTVLAHWSMRRIPAAPDALSAVLNTETFIYIVIPLSLLMLGLQQGRWPGWLSRERLHRWSWIGDISYSLYLIHFPLQLLLMLGLAGFPYAVRAQIFASPLVLIAFMATACGLAWLSFHAFEMPMRRILRDGLTRTLARRAAIR